MSKNIESNISIFLLFSHHKLGSIVLSYHFITTVEKKDRGLKSTSCMQGSNYILLDVHP